MRVRAQMSMLFHLDKCIGCHTCSVACKNLWTDRDGAEYMWWNNVETRPGTGYPTGWEDQEHYKGGWRRDAKGRLRLTLHSKGGGIAKAFYNPSLPELEDYYDPFTFKYGDLFDGPESTQQPTAVPISKITGKEVEISTGPNWDDDLGGSDTYAANDPSMEGVDENVRAQLEELERVVFNYLPRICNHCLNPSCLAACPSGAIYKRAEDGVVLVNEDACRGWRMCVSGCPYKKVYYNWNTGKSEKCILCFPRLETGQAPACAHSCVGRIRYMGVLLYDADRIEAAASVPDDELLDAQMDIILDPFDPKVIAAAHAAGLDDGWIDAAQRSPVYKFVKDWGMAFPLHPEFRTEAMMFYVPPLSPVMSSIENNLVRLEIPEDRRDFELLEELDKARLPLKYLANLFTVGDIAPIRRVLRTMLAVRTYKRRQSVDGYIDDATIELLSDVGLSETEAEAMYRLTTVPTMDDRFVFPPYHREMSIEAVDDPLSAKGGAGFGYPRCTPTRCMMQVAEVIALGYRYPAPGSAQVLADAVESDAWGVVQRHLRRFVHAVEALSLGEWEELHTATLDLSPKFVPYVGHVTWGENYRRGEFMADFTRELASVDVSPNGELPDHIEPILRYLAVASQPMTDLVEVLAASVKTMYDTLHKADPKNPYCELVAATAAFTADLRPVVIGGRR